MASTRPTDRSQSRSSRSAAELTVSGRSEKSPALRTALAVRDPRPPRDDRSHVGDLIRNHGQQRPRRAVAYLAASATPSLRAPRKRKRKRKRKGVSHSAPLLRFLPSYDSPSRVDGHEAAHSVEVFAGDGEAAVDASDGFVQHHRRREDGVRQHLHQAS